jgi:hypothetical protein
MSAVVLTRTAAASSRRLLADVKAIAGTEREVRTPAQTRLEAVLGREFADRLLAALSDEPRR